MRSPKIKLGTVVVDGTKCWQIREARGLSREWLAKQCKGVSAKTIERIEKNRVHPHKETLEIIAKTLGVKAFSLAVPTKDDALKDWLEYAATLDREGEFSEAVSVGEKLRKVFPATDSSYLRLTTLLASFYDHQNDWESAMDLLEEGLDEVRKNGQIPNEQANWALYLKGYVLRRHIEDLLLRTKGQMTKAIRLLLSESWLALINVDPGASSQLRVSKLHQCGVLKMVEQEFEIAIHWFKQSLAARQEIDHKSEQSGKRSFRQAYEYRRIGQCLALLGQSQEALENYQVALEITKKTEHLRLRREIERDMQAFGLVETSKAK